MAKNKKASNEARTWQKISDKFEYDWSVKREKKYPLSLEDWRQYKQEMRIQQRFWELNDIHAKGNRRCETSKPSSADSIVSKPWSLWAYDDVIRDEEFFKPMSEAEVEKATTHIEHIFASSAITDKGCTVICLSSKYQDFGDNGDDRSNNNGNICEVDRASIMLSSSGNYDNWY